MRVGLDVTAMEAGFKRHASRHCTIANYGNCMIFLLVEVIGNKKAKSRRN